MLEKLNSGLVDMISDVDNHVSSKRVVTFLCVIAVLVTWGANLFYKMQISDFIFNGLLYIVVAGLGVATVEKFSRSGGTSGSSSISGIGQIDVQPDTTQQNQDTPVN